MRFIIWLVLLTIIGCIGFWGASFVSSDTTNLEAYTFERINEVRKEEGLGKVKRSSELHQLAREHSENMASTGRFEHSDYPTNLGYLEAIAFNLNNNMSNFRITEAWLSSPGHKNILLDKDIANGAVGIAQGGGNIYATFMAN